MLFFIGLGLGSAKDITLRGLEIVKHSKKVYLEGYTSVLESTRVEMVCNHFSCFGVNQFYIYMYRKNYMVEKFLLQIGSLLNKYDNYYLFFHNFIVCKCLEL